MAEAVENLIMKLASFADLPAVGELPSGYSIKMVTPSELDGDAGLQQQLCNLQVAAFGEVHGAWTVARVREVFVTEGTVQATFCALHDGKVVGSASARHYAPFPQLGYLHWVGVLPDHRNKGLGRSLSLAVLNWFKEHDAAYCTAGAVLETQDERVPAIRVYRSLGFHADPTPATKERWDALAAHLQTAPVAADVLLARRIRGERT